MKNWSFSLLMILIAFPSVAAKTMSVKFDYDIADFNLTYDNAGQISILPIGIPHAYSNDSTQPMLPQILARIYIPQGYNYYNLSYTTYRTQIIEGVTLAPSPISIPTNIEITDTAIRLASYPAKIYPDNLIKYSCSNVWNGYNLASFLVCPFEYDAESKSLYFIHRFDVDISLEESNNACVITESADSFQNVASAVVNPYDIEPLINSKTQSYSDYESLVDEIRYLIITADSLKEAFRPLAGWKTTKGVNTKILSIEDINTLYSGADIQLKIKNCLNDYFENHGLKYALLGGDDTIVPVRYCHMSLSDCQRYIPSDLFYSTFNGTFNWDGDGDGIYGEAEDGIDLQAQISLSRLPIRTSADVQAYTNKMIAYEKADFPAFYKNNMLIGGWDLKRRHSTSSIAQEMGDLFYENYVKPVWDGTRIRLFDNLSDIETLEPEKYEDIEYSSYFTRGTLNDQLKNGYSYVEIICHGDQTRWEMPTWPYYSSDNATDLYNTGYTVITTMACDTNGFDFCPNDSLFHKDPCLSEAFIRGKDTGIVAYLGCSREGWYHSPASVTLSLLYDAYFYESLFGDNLSKNFGSVVARTKLMMVPFSQSNSANRWIQLGLNPMGDAEMPLYTEVPHPFTRMKAYWDENDCLCFDSGLDKCTFALSTSGHPTLLDLKENTDNYQLSGLTHGSNICVTKEAYIPQVFEYKNYLQNQIVENSVDIVSESILIGSDVTSSETEGGVVFDADNVTITSKETIIKNSTTIMLGTELIISNSFTK